MDRKVADLNPESRDFNLDVVVHELAPPVRIPARDGRPETHLVEAVVGDDSARVVLSLWGDAARGISPGDSVRVEDAFVKLVRGSMRVSVGRRGRVTRAAVELADADPGLPNLSDASHDDDAHARPRFSGGRPPRRTQASRRHC